MDAFHAGHGRALITPMEPVHMAGYGNRHQKSAGVHDDLFANAIALAGGGQTLLLVAFDLCSFEVADAKALKEAIGARTGLALEAVFVNTSHTHAGPQVGLRVGPPAERPYLAWVIDRATEAASQAIHDLKPSRLAIAAAPLDIGCNRREKTPDGRIILGLNPSGPRLAETGVWRFVREGAPDVALFTSANHGTTMGGDNLLISSEWMGDAVRKIEASEGGVRAVFVQGCCGDQNVYRDPRTFDMVARHGTAACAAVRQALAAAREVSPLPIVNIARDASLPLLDGGASPCPMHGLRLGDALMFGLGGEAFIEFALYARQLSRAQSTMALGYTDGNVGYLPTEQAYAEGGYETTTFEKMSYGQPWDHRMEHKLKADIKSLLEDLK